MKPTLMLSLGLAASLLLGGCASKTTQPSQYSGFLSDYSQLQPATSASGAPVLRWVSPDYKATSYRSVYIEKPVFYPAPTPSAQVRPPSTRSPTTCTSPCAASCRAA